MRVAEFQDVLDQQMSQLAIGVIFAPVPRPLPRGQMNLVNRDGFFQPVGLRPLLNPLGIPPFVLVEAVDDGRGVRPNFRSEGERVRLVEQLSGLCANAVFVPRSLAGTGDEPPPDARVARVQPVLPMLPAVAVGQDGDFCRIRSPHGKTDTIDSILSLNVSSQVMVFLVGLRQYRRHGFAHCRLVLIGSGGLTPVSQTLSGIIER